MSPRKVRLVADAIRGKSYPEAERTLHFLTRRASGPMEKLLRSAAANAKQNFDILEPSLLVVSEIRVDAGVTMKRQRPRARGRAAVIRKRTSRVLLILEAKNVPVAKTKKPKAAIEYVREADAASGGGEDAKREPERKTAREHIKTTKPTSFVQRMFRRKAI